MTSVVRGGADLTVQVVLRLDSHEWNLMAEGFGSLLDLDSVPVSAVLELWLGVCLVDLYVVLVCGWVGFGFRFSVFGSDGMFFEPSLLPKVTDPKTIDIGLWGYGIYGFSIFGIMNGQALMT